MLSLVLKKIGIKADITSVAPFGSGLINNTWHIKSEQGEFILQRINNNVFKCPNDIAFNIKSIATYFLEKHPEYFFVSPENIDSNDGLLEMPGIGFFRLFSFVKNSHAIDVVNTAEQAYEAARQFGKFTKLLNRFPAQTLKISLPDFHNLGVRYDDFNEALKSGNRERIKESSTLISQIKKHENIVAVFKNICVDSNFKMRVTHHDTKISNVLFNEEDKGICVIDLDTVMPGYFISDVGDMLRTYLSPVSEEERDFNKIEIRSDYFKAIAEGYLGEMQNILTKKEKKHFVYAGKFMIYMQAVRFLTDYLNNDIYYGSKYEGQNFIRAKNQLTLLERFLDKEHELLELTMGFIKASNQSVA